MCNATPSAVIDMNIQDSLKDLGAHLVKHVPIIRDLVYVGESEEVLRRVSKNSRGPRGGRRQPFVIYSINVMTDWPLEQARRKNVVELVEVIRNMT